MTTLTAFYDLEIGPVSYDFVVFMVKAKIEQKRINAERIHVVIVPYAEGVGGMFRDKTALYDVHEMTWRLWNIVIPACQLFDASVTLANDWLMAKRLASEKTWKCWPEDWESQSLANRRHLIGDVITASRAGVAIPRVQASEHARRKVREFYDVLGGPVVTMTLRQTYLPERNSHATAWAVAQSHIEKRGYPVVLLRDTSLALSSGFGYGELSLDIRAACYAESALNLQSNNGAASLCWFGPAPYRMFSAGVAVSEWDNLFVKQGLPLGTTWPWALKQQKLVYGPTTAEQIINEFEEWRTSASVMK